MRDYKKLQNGSDIRGVALSGIEGENPNLRDEDATRIGEGFLIWLAKKMKKDPKSIKISVGRDPRLSGKGLKDGLFKGFLPYGVLVYDCQLASTPAMFMSTQFKNFECDGAIMITASHLPFNRNGFKFFTKDGGLDKKDIKEILAYAESHEAIRNLQQAEEKTVVEKDLMEEYSDYLRKIIIKGIGNGEKPLEGMKIIVDAGNGSGGFYATSVLKPLGADVSQSQYLTPDGTFPNHMPNPEDKEAMESICMKVLSSKADLGLIFDTDVDRSAAVDKKGNGIGRNEIVALAAAIIAEEHKGTTVVTDSITSDQLTVFIEQKLGLKHLRYKRGYKNVINKAIELNEKGEDSQLAIETSGHAALKENYFLDDGAYLATKIVIESAKLLREGKGIDALIKELEKPLESKEYRIKIKNSDFVEYAQPIFKEIENLTQIEEGISLVEPNYEGIRLKFSKANVDGWILLRMSLHDPIIPINLESNIEGGTKKIIGAILPILKKYKDLDISTILK